MPTRQVNVQCWTIISHKPFDAVLAAVEAAIDRPNMSDFAARTAAATTYQDLQTVVNDSMSEIGLMEFMGSITARFSRKPEWKAARRWSD